MTDSQDVIVLALGSYTQMLSLYWDLGVSEEEGSTVFSEGKALASRAGDVRTLALLNGIYSAIRLAHGAEDHLDYAKQSVRLADGDLAMRRVVWGTALTRSLLFTGCWSEGLTCAEEAMDTPSRRTRPSEPRFSVPTPIRRSQSYGRSS